MANFHLRLFGNRFRSMFYSFTDIFCSSWFLWVILVTLDLIIGNQFVIILVFISIRPETGIWTMLIILFRTFSFLDGWWTWFVANLDHLLFDLSSIETSIKDFNNVRVPAFGQYVNFSEETFKTFSFVHLILYTHNLDGYLFACLQVYPQFDSKWWKN